MNETDWLPPPTAHARRQIARRGIPLEGIAAAVQYGREVPDRSGVVYRLDRRTIRNLRALGIDLAAHCGIEVVLTKSEDAIITAYRNQQPHRRHA